MRNLLALLPLLALEPTAFAADDPLAAPPTLSLAPSEDCPRISSIPIDRPRVVGPQTLDKMPDANQYLAVLRYDERRCHRPVIVRYGVKDADGR